MLNGEVNYVLYLEEGCRLSVKPLVNPTVLVQTPGNGQHLQVTRKCNAVFLFRYFHHARLHAMAVEKKLLYTLFSAWSKK